jgi:hypothetical protein
MWELLKEALTGIPNIAVVWKRVGEELPALQDFHHELSFLYEQRDEIRREDIQREFLARVNAWKCEGAPEFLLKLYDAPSDQSLDLIRTLLQSLNDTRIDVLENGVGFELALPLMLEYIEKIEIEYKKACSRTDPP